MGSRMYTDGIQIELARVRAWWPDGMPDIWRVQIRRWYGPAAETAAETINRAVCAGAIDPADFTIPDVIDAARAAGENPTRTLRRGISKLLASDLMFSLGTEDMQSTNKRPAYRPAMHYRLNPLSGAIARLMALGAPVELRRKLLSDATATRPAPGIDASGTVGRAAAHLRAQVEAGAPPRSYAALAADLGISRASVPAVLRRAGIVQVAQTATRAVTSADELPKQARRFAGQVRGRVLNVLIESEGGQVERLNYQGAASAEMVARHLAAGRTVKFEARCASAQQAGVSERDLTPDRTGQ